MSGRNTALRSMRDIGLAAWFGGGLMGVIGLNGGTAKAKDRTERLRLASIGWARWAPVQFAAIAVHGIGALGLVVANTPRLAAQREARTNSVVTTALTVAAGAASVAAGVAGAKILQHADEGAEGVTEPDASTSAELAAAQRAERILQWAIPLLTGALLVLGAQQGEQQRPAAGLVKSLVAQAKRAVGR